LVNATPITPAPAPVSVQAAAGDTTVPSPMPGKVNAIQVKPGDKVKPGDMLLILEAMKMMNEISSPISGTVKSVNTAAGDNVKPGQILIVLSA